MIARRIQSTYGTCRLCDEAGFRAGILSKIKLNSRKIAAPYYEDTRTAMIRHIQMVDGLYDLAVDFAVEGKERED